jgi:hypothetical protein
MTTVPADWVGFAEMIGGASGALTGLLFVSVSLNATRIAGHPGLNAWHFLLPPPDAVPKP